MQKVAQANCFGILYKKPLVCTRDKWIEQFIVENSDLQLSFSVFCVDAAYWGCLNAVCPCTHAKRQLLECLSHCLRFTAGAS